MRSSGRTRLYCLPYAGGSAPRIYSHWKRRLPAGIEVVPLELPARGTRMRERPLPRVEALVADALRQVLPWPGESFALFGHSLGGILAFELARALEHRHGRPPCRLLVSGARAPDLPRTPSLDFLLPDRQFRDRISALNGTPPQVLEDDELMELFLPVLRADFAAAAQWRYREGRPLSCPITVFGGRADADVPPASLTGWSRQTVADCEVHLLPGGHFFLDEVPGTLVPLVADRLLPVGSAARRP
ncbi:thioesterase II family protein [Streptomyces capoamus]|uniref:thioesterase II family protein n=1 Tax=Streptomyces capoamus TaxID=68183 RepID=UPI003C2F7462